MPDFTQNFNRYSYCVNNPLIYIDPSGEWFLIDDLIAAVVGGVINLTVNLIQGNVQNFGHGAALFGVGFLGGVASLYVSPLVGAGLVSGGNSILNQGFTNGWKNIDWGQVGISTTMGVATSYLGGQLGNALSKPISNLTSDIASPVLREAVTQGATNAATGFTLNAGLAWGSGASFEEGLKQGGQGALMGAGIGVMTGTVAGVQYARDNKVNPWTGKDLSNNRSTSSNVDNVLQSLDELIANGAEIKINPLNENQELNMTIKHNAQKLDIRIETHPLPGKYGGDGQTPLRHLNVDLYPKSLRNLPNNGHKILPK